MREPNLLPGKAQKATEAAPAKVNLTLHITGQRADGYHLLDSLVVFVDVADSVTVETSEALSLSVTGPRRMGVPADPSNLVWRAAEVMGAGPYAITLDKHLPSASGIGGGSSDAAATLRAIAKVSGIPLPSAEAILSLGADVPVCLQPGTVRMRGIGECITRLASLPPLWLVLVNPGEGMSTPSVFRALRDKHQAPMSDDMPTAPEAFCEWLAVQRNDLENPAMSLSPVIAEVLAALKSQFGCRLARMSGSGATCFGLFLDDVSADAARAAIARSDPSWWVAMGRVL